MGRNVGKTVANHTDSSRQIAEISSKQRTRGRGLSIACSTLSQKKRTAVRQKEECGLSFGSGLTSWLSSFQGATRICQMPAANGDRLHAIAKEQTVVIGRSRLDPCDRGSDREAGAVNP